MLSQPVGGVDTLACRGGLHICFIFTLHNNHEFSDFVTFYGVVFDVRCEIGRALGTSRIVTGRSHKGLPVGISACRYRFDAGLFQL